MPLLPGCGRPNPINNGVQPPIPNPANAPQLNPAQGDHVFGDVVGMFRTALQAVIGGGQDWAQRFESFNSTAFSLWQGFSQLDLGHAANTPVVQRHSPPETDQHAHMFGGYAQRFQWVFVKSFAQTGTSARSAGAPLPGIKP